MFLNKGIKGKMDSALSDSESDSGRNEDVFAIADVGGNTIMIFQKSGLKGGRLRLRFRLKRFLFQIRGL